MIRLSLGRTALAAALVWVTTQAAAAQDAGPPGLSPQTQKINELIRKGYDTAGVKKAAAKSTDHEFLRRVFIDVLGRIATAEEVIDFERDRSADKRVKLVKRLLYDAEYTPKNASGQPFTLPGAGKGAKGEVVKQYYTTDFAEHWANVWTVWLMSRSGHADYRGQMHAWLEYQFSKDISHKDMVVKLLTATGQVGGAKPGDGWPYKDEYAANFVVHHLGDPIRDDATTPEVNERVRDGAFDAVPVTSRVTKLFLGLQTQCTQCHDHPFNKEWVQNDFWGVNAFFRQTVRSATPSGAVVANNAKMANAVSVTLTDDPSLNPEQLVYFERRDGRRLGSFPVMLKDYEQAQNGVKSTKMLAGPPADGKTRRQQLAEWVTGHDNFSKAYVNRVWAHFFGRGLNKEASADDFGSNNEVVHPELLAYLGEEFAGYGRHSPKKLMEWICTSDVYQLSHVSPSKDLADAKTEYFTRMPLKAMSPEVLFESLMTATKPRKRTKDQQQEHEAGKAAWMGKLVRQFGDDEGNELSFNGTIVQALLMMNGKELNGELGVGRDAEKDNVITELMKKNGAKPGEMYRDLFLMTLNRPPTQAEVAKLDEVRNGKATLTTGPAAPPKGKGPPPKPPAKGTPPAKGGPTTVGVVGAAPGDPAFYQDVLWALLNTNEFMLNH